MGSLSCRSLCMLQKSQSESCSVMCDSLWPHGLHRPWASPGQNTGVGSFSLLQWIFPTQESNWGFLPCRQILYQLSYQGSPIMYANNNKKRLKSQEHIQCKFKINPPQLQKRWAGRSTSWNQDCQEKYQ